MDFNSFLKSLLALGEGKISDLHFKVGSPPLLRIRGSVEQARFNRLGPDDTKRIALALIGKEEIRKSIDDLRDYDGSYTIPNEMRFRVNIFRQRGALSIVMRVIPMQVPTIDELRLPEILKSIAMEERGLVLVTGVTGSGKSNTLAAMVSHVNQNRKSHIITIEDPIEFVHADGTSSIDQREIGNDSDTFGSALRAALRQDPDIILVGEMRDAETISIAIKAAETGHLVFSTLHTVDAPKTINRIVDTFPPAQQTQVRIQLSANLRAIISQRLLPTLDGGRIPAVEVLRWTTTVEDYILNAEKTNQIKDVIAAGRSQYGMQTFDQHLMEIYQKGLVDVETAIRAASSPADFQRALTYE